ncbi:MAG: hypothetical protein OXJ52_04500 [Oligoflexia bacterium]|nr:hypothetical protein [Oligoflexia bacterium]
MAGLDEKEREEFLAKLFLPLGAWGTTAVPARTASTTVTKVVKKLKAKKASKSGEKNHENPNPAEKDSKQGTAPAVQKTASINPEDVHIKKTGYNSDTQSDIFEVQFVSSNNKEIKFKLEISSDQQEKNKLEIEEQIKDIIEFEQLEGDSAIEIADFTKKEYDLLSNIQIVISKMSGEVFYKRNRITFDELLSMANKDYRDQAFKNALKQYNGGHSNAGCSKLSSIGPDNIHITKISHNKHETDYEIQFKTQKGKKISLKLTISKELEPDELPLDILKELAENNLKDVNYLMSAKHKMQIAIGQMPAEIFKGLKTITFANFKNIDGSVRPHTISMQKSTKISKITGELVTNYVFHKIHPRLQINESVMNAWLRATKGDSSHMQLSYFANNDGLIGTLAHELGMFYRTKNMALTPQPRLI